MLLGLVGLPWLPFARLQWLIVEFLLCGPGMALGSTPGATSAASRASGRPRLRRKEAALFRDVCCGDTLLEHQNVVSRRV